MYLRIATDDGKHLGDTPIGYTASEEIETHDASYGLIEHFYDIDPERNPNDADADTDEMNDIVRNLVDQLQMGATLATYKGFTGAIVTETIGDVIKELVPSEYLDYFQHNDGSTDWWQWSIETEVGQSVNDLLKHTFGLIEKLVDVQDETGKDIWPIWRAVAKQCLTWAFG